MTKQPRSTVLPATVLATALVVLAGCGQSGPLQLPQREPQPAIVPVENEIDAAAAEAAAVDPIVRPDATAPDATAPNSQPPTYPSE
ncbi:LPS translocon maturation chaperone LptM [Kineobactrum sediminis]|uniref:LPS translocon maturation chaperone LptM n=1 Tax=Kineobactrum sediminis TaxID=1905677 RepID=UPI0011AF677F|nr:lipoprotein [Kineobactrum sediminis]